MTRRTAPLPRVVSVEWVDPINGPTHAARNLLALVPVIPAQLSVTKAAAPSPTAAAAPLTASSRTTRV